MARVVGIIIVIVVFALYMGARNGWDKHGFIRIPFVTGPSKARIQEALGVDWVDVLERFPTVTSDHREDNTIHKGTTLYPIRVKIKDSAYEGQKADTGWSDERLKAANFAPFDTLDLYFYKNDFGAWKMDDRRYRHLITTKPDHLAMQPPNN